jgi:alpha-tubulin suppressor-like RCC1 family protein
MGLHAPFFAGRSVAPWLAAWMAVAACLWSGTGWAQSNYALTAWGESVIPPGFEARRFSQVAAGRFHSVGLDAAGQVTAWGRNLRAQCDVPAGLTGVVQVAAGDWFSAAVRSSGQVTAWGATNFGVTSVPSTATNIVALAAGAEHLLALRADGTVLAWGRGTEGQCTVPAGLDNIVAVAAGAAHSLALRSDGAVTAWGTNRFGLVSGAGSAGTCVGVAAGDWHALVLRADGTVLAWGDNSAGQVSVPAGLTSVVRVAAGGQRSAALLADGRIVSWGGGMAVTTNLPPSTGVYVGFSAAGWRTMSLRSDGLPDVTGWNGFGEGFSPGTVTGLVALAAGDVHGCVVSHSGSVQAWGPDPRGAVAVPALSNAVAVAAGAFHSVVIEGTTVRAWGDNADGQTSVPSGLTGVVAIACTEAGVVAATESGVVTAWGRDWQGETNVPSSAAGAVELAGGSAHVVARTPLGVVAWGNGAFGQTNVPTAAQSATAIASGSYHVLALGSDGTVTAWGRTNEGQCEVPADLTNAVAVGAGPLHSLAVRTDGSVVAWGTAAGGPTNVPATLTNAVRVAAGRYSGFALKTAESADLVTPAIIVQPQLAVAAAGGIAVFSVGVVGTGPFTFQWLRNGVEIAGATNASYQIPYPLLSDSGALFSVQVSDGVTTLVSSPAPLVVVGVQPPTITLHPGSRTVEPGGSTTFTVAATCNGPVTYQWWKDGAPVPGATGTSYTEVGVTPSLHGTPYFAVVTSGGGAVTSQVAVLSIGLPTSPSVTPIAISSRSAALMWTDNTTYETGWRFERRSPPAGVYEAVAYLPMNATRWVDTNGFASASARGYRVRAYNPETLDSAPTSESYVTRVPDTAPGLASVLVRGSARFVAAAADTGYMYFATWATGGTLMRVPVRGGALQSLVPSITNTVSHLQVTNGFAFWFEAGSTNAWIRAMPSDGGTAFTLYSGPELLVGNTGFSMAIGSNAIYWTDAPSTNSGRIQALFADSITNLAALASGTPVTVRGASVQPRFVKMREGRLWWSEYARGTATVFSAASDGTSVSNRVAVALSLNGFDFAGGRCLLSVPLLGMYAHPGTNGSLDLLAETRSPGIGQPVVGSSGVFFYDPTTNGIVRIPMNGGPAARFIRTLGAPTAIAVSDNAAFWATNGLSGSAGAVSTWEELPVPSLTSAAVVTNLAGQPLTYVVTASGFPVGFAASNVPAWASFNPATAQLTGTPPVPGTSTVTFVISNYQHTATAAVTFVAEAAICTVSAPAVWHTLAGAPFSFSLEVAPSGAVVSAGGLPAGVGYNDATRTVSGIAATGGVWTVMFTGTTTFAVGQASTEIIVHTNAANDAFSSAHALDGTNRLAASTLIGASSEVGEPLHGGSPGMESVWWTWTAQTNGRLALTTVGSECRTRLAVYTGSEIGGLTLVASGADTATNGSSRVSLSVTAGVTYRIAVALASAPAGRVFLGLRFFPAGLLYSAETVVSPAGLASVTIDPPPATGVLYEAGTYLTVTATPLPYHEVEAYVDEFGAPVDPQAVLVDRERVVTVQVSSGPVPGNDSFASATLVVGSVVQLVTSNYAATMEPGETAHATDAIGQSVWWRWSASGPGRLVLLVAPENAASRFAVYSGTNVAALTGLACVRAVLDGGTNACSHTIPSAGEYHIAGDSSVVGPIAGTLLFFPDTTLYTVEGLIAPDEGGSLTLNGGAPIPTSVAGGSILEIAAQASPGFDFDYWDNGSAHPERAVLVTTNASLQAAFVAGSPPPNDQSSNATVITTAPATVGELNRFATADLGEPAHAGTAAVRSVWWRWTASWAGTGQVTTAGSDFDTRLGVYTTNGSGWVVLGGVDNDPGTNHATVSFACERGRSYWFAVDSVGSERGNVQLALSQQIVPAAFTQWQQISFPPGVTPAEREAEADPDGDRLPNLAEYALGLNPSGGDPGPVFVAGRWNHPIFNEEHLALSFRLALDRPDVSWQAEVSDGLILWGVGDDFAVVAEDVAAADGRHVTVRDVLPIGASQQRFLRIRFLLNSAP